MTSLKTPLILASQSPRRKQLLADAGFDFVVDAPSDSVEKGICSKCSPEDTVLEGAFLKARAISLRNETGLILAADTIAECNGEILGKPIDRDHAERMLRLMSGRQHRVLTGVCLWQCGSNRRVCHIEQTVLTMDALSDPRLQEILNTDNWVGKAGGFGYQDGLDWLQVKSGLVSNVVGLPVEKLAGWIDSFVGKPTDQ
jgi:septum formation protein